MTRRLIQMTLVALFLLVLPTLPMAQEPPPEPELTPMETQEEAPKTATPPRQRKPGVTAEDLYKVKPSASEEKLQAAIDSLYRIIDWAEDDDPEKPEYYTKLANLYWEKAEAYFMQAYSDEMDQQMTQARDAGNEEQLAQLEARRQLLVDYQKEWRRKAIKIFQEVEENYPDYEKLDRILFYLGSFLTQTGDPEAGFEYYRKLVTRFPNSERLPDALLNLGEYFFNKDDFETAAEFYRRVKEFKKSRIYIYAVYKLGWCFYNTGDYEQAFMSFVEVIQVTKEMEKTGAVKIGLKDEAQRDIVYAFSQLAKETKALAFFKEIAPDIYMELGETLADLYLDQGENARAIAVYQALTAENPESPEVLVYQMKILVAADAMAVKKRTRQELIRFVELYEAFRTTNPDIVVREQEDVEKMLRRMAINYHLEAQKTGDKEAKLLAAELYGHYLRLFPEGVGRYDMLWNHAVLLYQAQQYEPAVEEFEKVVQLQPEGKYSRKAAYYAVYCYYQLIDTRSKTSVKTQEDDEVERKELPPLQANMVAACDRFVKMGSDDPEQLIQAKFAAARILYDFNHFDEAAARFAEYVQAYPEHETARDAAVLLLSSLSMARDIKSLNEWADRLYAMPSLAQGELLVLIQKIRDEAKFNRCFQYEFEKQFEAAADCFVDYTEKFQGSKLIDKALYNAALNYQRARKYEKALKANEALYNCCAKTSKLGPRSLYLIAETYRLAAVYDLAAQFFEEYATRHPKEQKVKTALMYASTFRRGLGQYDQATRDYQKYMSLFSKDPKVPAIYFDLGIMLANQGLWKAVVTHFNGYLKKFGSTGGINLELAAHQQIGEAYLKQRQVPQARKEFDTILALFQKLTPEEQKKIDARGVSAIAWAYFNLGDMTAQEATKIKFTRRNLKEATDKKLSIIQAAEASYLTVHSMGHPYWSTAALFRIGSGWERFANDLENSPLPTGLNEMEQEDYRFELSQAAEKIRKGRAVPAYSLCLEVATQHRIFNDFTEQAQQNLADLSMESGGLKEYRIRPGYFEPGVNLPAFKTRKVDLYQAADTPRPPGGTPKPDAAPDTRQPGGEQP